jgi:hypothetical protein
MDNCYISYIFSGKTGFRIPFPKETCVQLISNVLKNGNTNKYIILFRFNKNKDIVLTLWIPNYFKIADLIHPTWYQSLKTFNKNSILITPRGNFKLKEIKKKFIEYCDKHHKIKTE